MREGARSAWGGVSGWERGAEGAERKEKSVLAFISAKMFPMARTPSPLSGGTNPPLVARTPPYPPSILRGLARGGS